MKKKTVKIIMPDILRIMNGTADRDPIDSLNINNKGRIVSVNPSECPKGGKHQFILDVEHDTETCKKCKLVRRAS